MGSRSGSLECMGFSKGGREINMAFWSGRRVFVTGASGLVGSYLVEELVRQGAFIVCLVKDWNPQSELIRSGQINQVYVVQGRLEDYQVVEEAINEYEIDTVFHLGAQTIVQTALRAPLYTFESNIRGTYNLLEACRRHRNLVHRILIASSDKAYGSSEVLPYVESMPLQGRHPYDVSKSCTDLIAQCFATSYKMPIVISRCGNIYGGGDLNWNRLIPGVIKSLLEDSSPVIRSNGQFTRDYVYVKDVVDAYLALMEHSDRCNLFGEAYNFGPNRPYTVLEVVKEIQVLMEKEDIQINIEDTAQGEIKDQSLSSVKITGKIGWQPRYSLELGLNETITWYREFLRQSQTVIL